ncbi:hypothetical protein SLEP1_g5619 [Rubroshorea leprosula]|uniref:Uncharacterized protein n=1 Tax=Rubroshorea leprosula TaxID=152421 RepID=A0AAV5I1I3_9ROSI|nr:hypothetical protein SLEP1_g5619 [Rubroshorea leprosula]
MLKDHLDITVLAVLTTSSRILSAAGVWLELFYELAQSISCGNWT